MKFQFNNLDTRSREIMLSEVESDIAGKKLFDSKRFNDLGSREYPSLLRDAIVNGDEQTLANELKTKGCFKETEERQTKKGIVIAKVPETASETFAEGEFNRFYIRAICIRAISDSRMIEIYRARQSNNPRIESEGVIGVKIDPQRLLQDLRENIGVDTALGLPPGPNSGLSVMLI